MKNALPILAAGAAVLLLGNKKKKSPSSSSKSDPAEDQDADEGTGPIPDDTDDDYGKVANGIRKDRRGHHPWRIMYNEDGYTSQIMTDTGRFARVDYEVGVAASQAAAKKMLRDFFNQALLEAGYSKDDFKQSPMAERLSSNLSMG